MLNWLKHAFAVNTHPAPPTDEQQRQVDHLAREIARRQLSMPALAFLEMSRPLNYLGAQAMHFFSPILSAVLDAQGYEAFARFLERRDAIDILCQRIEHWEQLAQKSSPQQNQTPSRSEPS